VVTLRLWLALPVLLVVQILTVAALLLYPVAAWIAGKQPGPE
jgi:hypothetical protein